MHVALFTSSMTAEPLASERSRPFLQSIPQVFEVADAAEGFVRRGPPILPVLDAEGRLLRLANPAVPAWHAHPDRVVQTLTVWRDLRSAWGFTYGGLHLASLSRRAEFFDRPARRQYVLWWIDDGAMPGHAEGVERLARLDAHGPTPVAFDLRTAFDERGEPASARA